MSAQDEKKGRYLFGVKPEEDTLKYHGSRTVDNTCRYMLPALQQMLTENPKRKLLDVGCGPGSITIGFAQLMPEGEVVGLDHSNAVLEKAKEAAEEQRISNIAFVQAEVYSLPYEDGTFDVVHTHQAVAHFHEHVRAIRELIRVTKRGGMVCMREGDLHTSRFYPDSPVLEECWKTIIAVQEANGGLPDVGLRLKAWTVEAGVSRQNIIATAGTSCYNTPEARQRFGGNWPGRLSKGALPDRAVELGICTRERLEEYAEAWRKWTADEDGWFYTMHGEVIARI